MREETPTDAEKLEIIKECAKRVIESSHRVRNEDYFQWVSVWELCVMQPRTDPSDDPPICNVDHVRSRFTDESLTVREEKRRLTEMLWERFGGQLSASDGQAYHEACERWVETLTRHR